MNFWWISDITSFPKVVYIIVVVIIIIKTLLYIPMEIWNRCVSHHLVLTLHEIFYDSQSWLHLGEGFFCFVFNTRARASVPKIMIHLVWSGTQASVGFYSSLGDCNMQSSWRMTLLSKYMAIFKDRSKLSNFRVYKNTQRKFCHTLHKTLIR